ncbi:MAG: hypothetical protein AB7V18_17920 [Pyrinomonadaceae bacterium]
MKRHSIAILIGTGTFLVGVILATIYYFQPAKPEIVGAPSPIPTLETCKENSSSFPGLSRSLNSIKKYKNGYFPEKAFDDGWSGADGSFDEWYGKHLRAMEEPSLLDVENPDTETYRFLWLRSFNHPISVRVERIGYSFRLKSVELSGTGGYDPGKIIRTDDVEIFSDQWCQFTSLIDKTRFWEKATSDSPIGRDGAQWILEGVNDERYHIVNRWSPRDETLREACIYLLKLSGRDEKSLEGNLY